MSEIDTLRAHVARLTLALKQISSELGSRPIDWGQDNAGLVDVATAISRQALALTPEAIAADAEVLRLADELSTARRAYLRWCGIGPISDETHADWIIFLESQEKLDVAVDRSRKARGAT